MFENLRRFLSDLAPGSGEKIQFQEDDDRLAVAALMVHIISVDGIVADSEKVRLTDVLRDKYELSEAQTRDLIAKARARDEEAIDLYSFTSVLKRRLDENERRNVVEMLWEIVYADGTVNVDIICDHECSTSTRPGGGRGAARPDHPAPGEFDPWTDRPVVARARVPSRHPSATVRRPVAA